MENREAEPGSGTCVLSPDYGDGHTHMHVNVKAIVLHTNKSVLLRTMLKTKLKKIFFFLGS